MWSSLRVGLCLFCGPRGVLPCLGASLLGQQAAPRCDRGRIATSNRSGSSASERSGGLRSGSGSGVMLRRPQVSEQRRRRRGGRRKGGVAPSRSARREWSNSGRCSTQGWERVRVRCGPFRVRSVVRLLGVVGAPSALLPASAINAGQVHEVRQLQRRHVQWGEQRLIQSAAAAAATAADQRQGGVHICRLACAQPIHSGRVWSSSPQINAGAKRQRLALFTLPFIRSGALDQRSAGARGTCLKNNCRSESRL